MAGLGKEAELAGMAVGFSETVALIFPGIGPAARWGVADKGADLGVSSFISDGFKWLILYFLFFKGNDEGQGSLNGDPTGNINKLNRVN